MKEHPEGHDGLTEAARRRVGSVLNNKWRLDHLLGLGGMAAVYAATHRNGHRVAIKVLHGHFSYDETLRGRLQQEGYVANRIDHPGALRILDDDRTEDGAVFLVMELLHGEALDARLKRKGWRLPVGEALGIVFSVLDVMAAAHARGIIHRDIKPDNIFITREGEIKVLDFGIARVLDMPPGISRTRNGALFGTLGFMAPEQALGRTQEIDGRTDLWAIGATLFTLLSGRLVHEAPTPNEQLVSAATREAPPLSAVMPGVEPALAALVDHALAFQPANRWQSAVDMQEAIRTVGPTLAGAASLTLQVPRVSVEVDVDAVLQARAGWTSTSLPIPRIGQTMLTANSHGRWRLPRTILAATGAALLVAGTLTRCGQRESPAGVASERATSAGLATSGLALAASTSASPKLMIPTKSTFAPATVPASESRTDVSSRGPVPSPATPTSSPSPVTSSAVAGSTHGAPTAPSADAAPAEHDPARAEHRIGRRLGRGYARHTALPGSVISDDALWSRRH